MTTRKWCVVGVAVLLGAALTQTTFGQEAMQSRQLPSTALHKMKPTTIHASNTTLKKYGASKNGGISMAASSSGVSGIKESGGDGGSLGRTTQQNIKVLRRWRT